MCASECISSWQDLNLLQSCKAKFIILFEKAGEKHERFFASQHFGIYLLTNDFLAIIIFVWSKFNFV